MRLAFIVQLALIWKEVKHEKSIQIDSFLVDFVAGNDGMRHQPPNADTNTSNGRGGTENVGD